jgi:hypothetical protein
VVFARRPHGYFNVLAEGGEKVNEAAQREVARAIARQRRGMGLRNAEDFPGFGLGDAPVLDDAVDLERQARLQKFLVSVGQPEVGKGIVVALGHGGASSGASFGFHARSASLCRNFCARHMHTKEKAGRLCPTLNSTIDSGGLQPSELFSPAF